MKWTLAKIHRIVWVHWRREDGALTGEISVDSGKILTSRIFDFICSEGVMIKVKKFSIAGDPGNMRRANHGSACLPIQSNQDVRVDHQVRQVERREARAEAKRERLADEALRTVSEAEKRAKLLLPQSPAPVHQPVHQTLVEVVAKTMVEEVIRRVVIEPDRAIRRATQRARVVYSSTGRY